MRQAFLLLATVNLFTALAMGQALHLSGEYHGTHDPSIAKEAGTYYVFATGAAYPTNTAEDETDRPPAPGEKPHPRPVSVGQIQIRCSSDLLAWKRCGAVFPEGVPAWIRTMSPKTQDLWAPDISYFQGEWHLYYAFSVFGKNTSGIALLTNKTLNPGSPEYKWVDRGLVLQSFANDNYNAIDPNIVLDRKGQPWMSFGSFWSGIKMRRIDRTTGLLEKSDPNTYALASRTPQVAHRHVDSQAALPPDTQAIEAPFIVQHGAFYYLFVSWDLCCRGAQSTYREMVGRSAAVTGPYVDREGKPMLGGNATQVLHATGTWAGPGGASILQEGTGQGTEKDLIVYHVYNPVGGRPSMQISPIRWVGGWPEAQVEGPAK